MEVGIREVADELNARAHAYDIGKLQTIRKRIHNLGRLPSKKIFTSQTISSEWAFHVGGRSELQFNIGLEKIDGVYTVRFGVAFSLEITQSLLSIDVLVPKVALFNDYITGNYEDLAGMRMWHYTGSRSADSSPAPIPPELVRNGVFIFLGIRQPLDSLDYDAALAAMDRLLPLYLHTESSLQTPMRVAQSDWEFTFKPGCTRKASSANATLARKELDVQLRHNDIQLALYKRLVAKYGDDNVAAEQASGPGVSVDIAARDGDDYIFYEIKTARTARGCIRQALGQLFEYSFWPGCKEAIGLVVVGEPALDDEARDYLDTLRDRFSLPISYESISI